MLSVLGAFILGGKPVLGWIADSLGIKTAVVISFLCQTVGVGFLWADTSFFSALAGVIIYGFGKSGMTPLLNTAKSGRITNDTVSIGTPAFSQFRLVSGSLRIISCGGLGVNSAATHSRNRNQPVSY